MALYANTLMPGLGRADDRTFVGAFQAIDTRIINPWFLMTFLGALVFTSLAVLLHLGQEFRLVLPWIVAAGALYLATVVVTLGVNVPLNDGIKAAGPPDQRFLMDLWSSFSSFLAIPDPESLQSRLAKLAVSIVVSVRVRHLLEGCRTEEVAVGMTDKTQVNRRYR